MAAHPLDNMHSIPGATTGGQLFFCNKQLDTIFHLSPFTVQLHENSISPIHVNTSPEDNCLGSVECDSELSDHTPKNQNCLVSRLHSVRAHMFVDCSYTQFDNMLPHVVPTPSSTVEAYLLLEATHADWKVWLARQTLVHQIVCRNTLMLQYNRLMLEKAQDELHAADCFVGHVRATIRQSVKTGSPQVLLGGPGGQGTRVEVSPDTSRA